MYDENGVNITHVESEKKYSGSHCLHFSLHAYKYRALTSTPVISPMTKYSPFRHNFSSPFDGFQTTLTNFYKLREN